MRSHSEFEDAQSNQPLSALRRDDAVQLFARGNLLVNCFGFILCTLIELVGLDQVVNGNLVSKWYTASIAKL